MVRKKYFRIAALVLIGMSLLASCKQEKAVTVDPSIMLTYGKDANEQNLENLAKNYATVINKNRKSGVKQPGLYSDYAVALAKQGKNAEANNWFNKEMAEFPSSRKYVIRLKQELIPEYVNDNTVRNNDAVENPEEPTLSPAARAEAEEKAASIMKESEGDLGNISVPANDTIIRSEVPENEADEKEADEKVEEEELKAEPIEK